MKLNKHIRLGLEMYLRRTIYRSKKALIGLLGPFGAVGKAQKAWFSSFRSGLKKKRWAGPPIYP